MQHHFDVELAKRYGILEAVLLNHFQFWEAKNRANDVNFHDGLYWTYNSVEAFAKLFPYVSKYQIRRALKHLEDENLIITGNYNKAQYDRTTWYALSKTAQCILQNQQMEVAKKQNGICEKATPIPDNNTYNDTYNNIIKAWNNICTRKKQVDRLTSQRKVKIKNRLKEYSYEDIVTVFHKVNESDFLCRWNGCTFDWVMKSENNMSKIMSDNYKNSPKYTKSERELIEAYNKIGGSDDYRPFGD